MDPATATAAAAAAKTGISLYEAGGFALLLLAIVVVLVGFGGWFLVGLIRDLGKRLNNVEDQKTNTLSGVIDRNTAAMSEVKTAVHEMRDAVEQQTDALRARPCLIETGTHPRPALPRQS